MSLEVVRRERFGRGGGGTLTLFLNFDFVGRSWQLLSLTLG